MTEFTINEKEYSFYGINVFDADFVHRKIKPHLEKLSYQEDENGIKSSNESEVFAGIPEEDVQGIYDRILPCIKIKNTENWTQLYVQKGRQFLFPVNYIELQALFFNSIGAILNPLGKN